MDLANRTVTQVRQAVALLEAASKALGDVAPAHAVLLARAFAQAEKVAMAGTRRAVIRAGDEGARRHGGERDMAGLAARLTGTTLARARQGLKSAERAADQPEVEKAYVAGTLSFDQASVVTDAATVVPGSGPELLREAECSSLVGLRATAAARMAAQRGEDAALGRERRLVGRRFCRIGPASGGGVRLEALLPTEEGARVMKVLGDAADRRWRRAWSAGRRLTMDQARADALVGLCTGSGGPEAGPSELVVTVDAAALVRGETGTGEICRIDGVGPVPVATARGLLGEAFLTLCVTDGKDVRTVTSTSRVVPTRVRRALALRDPSCVVPGCGQQAHLEIDHWRLDFARGGLTNIDNLCRLCAPHHRLKTRTGWRIDGGPDRWRWRPPRAPAV